MDRFESAGLPERYRAVRDRTTALAAPLSAEDAALQSMPDASPAKWHLAHTTWFFETFVLQEAEPQAPPFHPAFRVLFNSYYVGVGERHPRPERGLLSRPGLEEVRAYRAAVDERMARLLDRGLPPALAERVELGLQHEEQHQELLLTDLLHLFSRNPMAPAYRDGPPPGVEEAPDHGWLPGPAGLREIGHSGAGFSFDNERPRHRVWLEEYELAAGLVTNAGFEAFVADGGYRRPELWLAEGWDACRAQGWEAPLYWRGVNEFTLHGLVPRNPAAPVAHVSYYEADAYARWAGARLPSEAEWEALAACASDSARFFGARWQWTSSAYAPYPGFRAAAGAIGEYNGKFMVNQYVLRGASWATPPAHSRATYRNFFPAAARWQATGIRLARSPQRENGPFSL